jgi:hypothetical protein
VVNGPVSGALASDLAKDRGVESGREGTKSGDRDEVRPASARALTRGLLASNIRIAGVDRDRKPLETLAAGRQRGTAEGSDHRDATKVRRGS